MPTPATPTWNGFTASSVVPYQRQDFWNMMITAYNERAFHPAAIAAIARGDDIQSLAARNLLLKFEQQSGIITFAPGNWVDIGQYGAIAGSTTATQHAPLYRNNLFAEYLGLSLGWPRKAFRMISAANATSDYYGNAAAAGQYALGTPGSGLFGVMKYDGTNWNLARNAAPDTLDAYATPAQLPIIANGAANDLANDTGHPGAVYAYDRMGPWLFSTYRDVCNQMQKWQFLPGPGQWYVNPTASVGYGTGSTWAAAQAAAEADWPTAGADLAWNHGPGAWSQGVFNGTTYTAVLVRQQSTLWSPFPASATWAANVDAWVRILNNPPEGNNTGVFDANGDSPAAVGWMKYATTLGATGTDVMYTEPGIAFTIGNAGGGMPDWCDTPSNGNPKVKGWCANPASPGGAIVVFDFDCAGGFTYTSSSP